MLCTEALLLEILCKEQLYVKYVIKQKEEKNLTEDLAVWTKDKDYNFVLCGIKPLLSWKQEVCIPGDTSICDVVRLCLVKKKVDEFFRHYSSWQYIAIQVLYSDITKYKSVCIKKC